jgi:glucose/arabinose dehydrogenase
VKFIAALLLSLSLLLPPGFAIEVYADVPNARSMALGENGTIFVSNRRASSVYAIVRGDSGGRDVLELVSGLATPNGVAYFNGDLYVAEPTRILRFKKVAARLDDMPEPVELDIKFPGDRLHGWRYIGFGPDEKLYMGIGAPCNVCDRGDEGYAQIIRMNPDGSDRETFVEGIRNSVGFTWHPDSGELWFTDNGRDMMGDDIPPGELNHAPVQELGPHVAPLGLKFYTGDSFPAEYQGQIFIAEHGSWNRSKKIGYRVSLVRLGNGKPASYEVFAEG